MALTPSWPGPTGLTTTTDGRKAVAGLIVKDTAGVARSGVFPAHANPLVTARADMNVDIAPFTAVGVQFGGPVLFSNDGTAQLPSVLVAPVSGSNYYVLYAKQNESTAPGTDANNNRVLGMALSAVSFAAARALLPEGAVELATVQVPAGTTQTNSGAIITATHRFTAASGGTVWLRNQAEQDTWTPVDGSLAFRVDTDTLLIRQDGAWVRVTKYRQTNSVGTGTSTTATGTVTVSHNLGTDQIRVWAQDINAGAAAATRKLTVNTVTSTQIQFVYFNSGEPFASNPIAFYWVAELITP